MARAIHRLNARQVAALKAPGRHADGGNLYLSVSPSGAKSWTFLFRWHGKRTEVGLGSARAVTLARARELAAGHRAALAAGLQPARKRQRSPNATFSACATALISSMRPSWRSERHARQWSATLAQHASTLSNLPIDAVDTADVLRVLTPLWADRYATASRLRGRIERVLDYARASGLRSGENPARWRGHLDHLLPAPPRLQRPHHAAMAYSELPGFMERLRAQGGPAARALEFAILTAARAGEARLARREEFRLDAGLWTIPAGRTKSGREHVVPLSPRAIELVRLSLQFSAGDFVFGPISDQAMGRALHRIASDVTVHGFRSSFRDWAGDRTNHPREVVEAALAHAVPNATEAAYRRSTALDKRRGLMDAWAGYCARDNLGTDGAAVVHLRSPHPSPTPEKIAGSNK